MTEPGGGAAIQSAHTRLDASLASGIAWTAALRWASQGLSWGATFWAARLLAPRDYGLVSMAALSIGLVRLAENFGLDAVLVQDQKLDRESEARLAGMILGIGIVLVGVFAVIAPAIAGFFHEPQVERIIRAMSLLLVFDAVQVVPRARLQRELAFRRLAIIAFVRSVGTAAVLLWTIGLGFGYWSLVLNAFGGAVMSTALFLMWSPYRVAWPRNIANLSRPLLQGWRVLASRAAWYGYSSADQTIIGRALGSAPLGAYSFATTFSTVAQEEIGSIVSQVVPGVFSQVQNNVVALRRYFVLLTEFLTVLSFPISVGMALVADLAIPLILGDQWKDVVIPLRLLCFYSVFLSSQTLVSHVLLWTGQFRVQMWCSMVALVGMPLTFLVAVQYGPIGIAIAWAVVFPLLNIPALVFGFRTINLTVWEWFDSLWPAIASSAMMAAAVIIVRLALPTGTSLLTTTVVSISAGGVAYPVALWFVFRQRVKDIVAIGLAVRSGNADLGGFSSGAADG